MHQNDIFIIFLKLFLRSAHQNDLKHTKKINFFKKIKKIEFLWNAVCTAFPNSVKVFFYKKVLLVEVGLEKYIFG
jgi:hypothetical protein